MNFVVNLFASMKTYGIWGTILQTFTGIGEFLGKLGWIEPHVLDDRKFLRAIELHVDDFQWNFFFHLNEGFDARGIARICEKNYLPLKCSAVLPFRLRVLCAWVRMVFIKLVCNSRLFVACASFVLFSVCECARVWPHRLHRIAQ